MPLADVVGGVRRELVRRHADDDPVRGGVHDASEPPEVLRQEQPAAPAGLGDAEGVKRKADVNEVEPILVVARGPSPWRPPAPPALEVVEQRPQGVHLRVHARGRTPADAIEAPGDDLTASNDERQVVVPGAASAGLILSNIVGAVDPLFRPAPPPPVGGLSPGPRRKV